MELKTGLWEKNGNNGIYYSGSVDIAGQKHWVNLFMNDKGDNDKRPDMNLIIKPANPA